MRHPISIRKPALRMLPRRINQVRPTLHPKTQLPVSRRRRRLPQKKTLRLQTLRPQQPDSLVLLLEQDTNSMFLFVCGSNPECPVASCMSGLEHVSGCQQCTYCGGVRGAPPFQVLRVPSSYTYLTKVAFSVAWEPTMEILGPRLSPRVGKFNHLPPLVLLKVDRIQQLQLKLTPVMQNA